MVNARAGGVARTRTGDCPRVGVPRKSSHGGTGPQMMLDGASSERQVALLEGRVGGVCGGV